MSQANNFTRRLIADFFAARLGARPIESGTSPPLRRDVDPTPLPREGQDPSLLADLGDPGGAEASEID